MASNSKSGKKKSSGSSAKKTGSKYNSPAASSNRSTSSTQKKPGKPTSSAGTQKQEQVSFGGRTLARDAGTWLLLAVCVFILVSYFGIGGMVGSCISDFSFGLFGTGAWVLPFLLFISVSFFTAKGMSGSSFIRFMSGVVLYLSICSLLELFVNGSAPDINLSRIYLENTVNKTGGGTVGAVICSSVSPVLGFAGTAILLLVLVMICLVLMSQKPLFDRMKSQGRTAVRSAVESQERRKERSQKRRQIRQEEREQARRQQMEERQLAHEQRMEELRLSGQQLTDEMQKAAAEGEPQLTVSAFSPQAEENGNRNRKQKKNGRDSGAGAAGQTGPRTELEVPVIFHSQPRPARKNHRVSGTAVDTRIESTGLTATTDMQQVVPPRRKAVVTAFPQPDETAQSSGSDPELHIYQTQPGSYEIHRSSGPDSVSGNAQKTEQEPVKNQEAALWSTLEQQDSRNTPDFSEHPEETGQPEDPEDMGQPDELRVFSVSGRSGKSRSSGKKTDRTRDAEDSEESGSAADAAIRSRGSGRMRSDDIWADENGGDASGKVFSEKTAKSETAEVPSKKKQPRSSEREIEEGIASVEEEVAKTAEAAAPVYVFPPIELLRRGKASSSAGADEEVRRTAAKLQQTLDSFGVHATVTNVNRGPTVTRYELAPEQGVKVSRIVGLADDIKLNLAAADIRIEAPIPGKAAVGIEVPNEENSAVMLRDLLESPEFEKASSSLSFATGKDIGGKVVISDIARMPHVLIAGATGSGKSVCINTIIMSILYKAKPEDVRMIMIDPKVVELSVYNGIPHLLIPVVTDPKKAAGALNWGVAEMMERYNKFAEMGVRDIKGYNQRIAAAADVTPAEGETRPEKMAQILIIVDELADLMMVAPGEVEDSICRLAQLARAAGIHLVIATQRPSVNVITGLIKANMPSRIAFAVTSGVDSRTILDMVGAEKLLGKGDMLFYPQNYQKPARVQGAFVSDEEVSAVVDFLKESNSDPSFRARTGDMKEQMEKMQSASQAGAGKEESDSLFVDAAKFIIEKDKASIGMLQRVFKIGFNRAARIMDQLSDAGVVGPEEGTKPRKILMTMEEFENKVEQGEL